MQRASLLIITVLAFSVRGIAQTYDLPRGDLFGGYSYLSADVGSGNHYNLQGFVLSGDHNLKPWLAIAHKEDSYWGPALIPFCTNGNTCFVQGPRNTAHLNTILGGLRLAHTGNRYTPFARALFGVSFLFGCMRPGCESKAGYSQDFSGGVQVRLTERRLGWRAEAGLMQTHLFGAWQNDLRISTGPVLFFYGRK